MATKIEQPLFLFFLIILLMSFLINQTGVEGRFISISVVFSSEIKSKHDAAIFNFDVPDYAGSMVGDGATWYSTLVQDNINQMRSLAQMVDNSKLRSWICVAGSVVYPGKGKGANGCKPFDGDEPFKSKSTLPTILLLDRGDCYVALKVWNGQQAGVTAVLVDDNIYEPLISMNTPKESYGEGGFTENINIPSLLIKKSFGQILKESIDKGEDLVVKIEWTNSEPHLDN